MQGTIRINDITPYGPKGCIEHCTKNLINFIRNYRDNLKLSFYEDSRSFIELFGQCFDIPNTHTCWNFEFTRNYELIIYINIWENERLDRWGERYGEIKLVLTDFVTKEKFPNLLVYIDKLNDQFRYCSENEKRFSFSKLLSLVEIYEYKYNFKENYIA